LVNSIIGITAGFVISEFFLTGAVSGS